MANNKNPKGKADEIQSPTLTLRFKHGKHTIFLLSEPLTPFGTIKSELVFVLHERYPNGLPTSLSATPIQIPGHFADVILGLPKDMYDPGKGWTEFDTSSVGGGIKKSPKSLGLKDGAQIAFAFVGDDEEVVFHVEYSNIDEMYPEDD